MKSWQIEENRWFLSFKQKEKEKLESGTFIPRMSLRGPYLEKIGEKFEFSHKLYGLEKSLIQRIEKTYESSTGNMGVLLNGLKGTGKTVTAKMICNRMKIPTIIIQENFEGMIDYINSIPEDIIVFVDEYEKIYKDSHELLSIMDGSLNSVHRRIFLMTTNNLYVNENLLQRPGRVRYVKTFEDLKVEVIEEIVKDCLTVKKLEKEVIEFISSLETITVDIVKAICQEVNIHKESPKEFEEVFNVKKKHGKYDVFIETKGLGRFQILDRVSTSLGETFLHSGWEGSSFYADNVYLGNIQEIISDTEAISRATFYIEEKTLSRIPEKERIFIFLKIKGMDIKETNPKVYESLNKNTQNLISKTIDSKGMVEQSANGKGKIVETEVVFKISLRRSVMLHQNFKTYENAYI